MGSPIVGLTYQLTDLHSKQTQDNLWACKKQLLLPQHKLFLANLGNMDKSASAVNSGYMMHIVITYFLVCLTQPRSSYFNKKFLLHQQVNK